ncbi:DRTGG domain-containing protein [Leptolyngbya sp. FACHB-261]|uniref:phosphotransacetylase family protein n=1 Tax=Leptolyngbya sp. FACHB-261 TaxID=2692806 RepID=UPI0016842346|nr:DRTGG domain-containing protein [Leptolyngbya sp. FACHB-261]MBD2101815.1 phosphotransacetylase family protein [Leptolyngbya sp. FACHB-261]
MPQKLQRHLLIGSTEPYSGKSAVILGLASLLQDQSIDFAYGKPLGTCFQSQKSPSSQFGQPLIEEDVLFMTTILNLGPERIRPTVLNLDEAAITAQLQGQDHADYPQRLAESWGEQLNGDLVLMEGPGDLDEGRLFDLSLSQVATRLQAQVLLVSRFRTISRTVDPLLAAKQQMGEQLLGVVINDIPPDQLSTVENTVKPFLESQGIAVLGVLPANNLLRSVSVAELVRHLDAEVLCCGDRLDLMVENLTIGAMNVSSALKYFRRANNKAVVTGGDRTDIQFAALETSTHCLILTGHLPPPAVILQRAEELEVPILSVDHDTLTTVAIAEHTFGQVRVNETAKVQCIQQLMAQHFDLPRLLAQLGLELALKP